MTRLPTDRLLVRAIAAAVAIVVVVLLVG